MLERLLSWIIWSFIEHVRIIGGPTRALKFGAMRRSGPCKIGFGMIERMGGCEACVDPRAQKV